MGLRDFVHRIIAIAATQGTESGANEVMTLGAAAMRQAAVCSAVLSSRGLGRAADSMIPDASGQA
jgi:hypothetical protein